MTARILRLADGTEREARTWPCGDYACPFCGAAVKSPDGWDLMQRLNAEHYARTGEPYTAEPYPQHMRAEYEAGRCPNPACDTWCDAAQLAARQADRAERQAEQDRRERNHELAMQRIAEYRAAEQARYEKVMAQCDEQGKCRACAAHRLRTGGPLRLVRHRDPDNCPQKRRWAA